MRGYHIRISLSSSNISSLSQNQIIYPVITPNSVFAPLPVHKARPLPATSSLTSSGRDYRLGPLRIDWVDFYDMSATTFSGTGKERALKGPVEAAFVPRLRKSGETNLPEGVIHIYRDPQNRPAFDSEVRVDTQETAINIILGVLAVPSWMTPSDFLVFVAPASEGISHLRIIRDSAPNRSIVLIKFRNPDEASEFCEAYNGKPFNSMEPEICHVVRILSIEIEPDDSVSQNIERLASAQGTMYELPTCPVCLERMDSAVTGLITVPCSHTFHCMCLSKWGDSRCPVCRYSQTLLTSHPSAANSSRAIPFAGSSPPSLSYCNDCSSITNLWICLICGNIGCGRYGRAHAHGHYQSTAHLYALELETQRVWDYAGDGYVHRLIQNKADGKLVELPSAATLTSTASRDGYLGPSQADALNAEKIETIGIEYSYLLTSQLDSQRAYYEEQAGELKTQLNELRDLVNKLSKEYDLERETAKENEARLQKGMEKRVTELVKEKNKSDNKAERMAELARRLEKELKEERAVSKGLMENLQKMKEKGEGANRLVEDSNRKIQELEDQVRDVMFFLEAKTKIEKGEGVEGEAAGGSIELRTQLPTSSTTTATRRKVPRKG